jgi:PPOX class probable F420-dependent enzyme
MAIAPNDLTPEMLMFLGERHLGFLITQRADGSPHAVPVGFAFDAERSIVRIISADNSQKVRNAERGGRAVVSQVDGGLEGSPTVKRDEVSVAAAERAYAERYQEPRPRNDRVAIEISVDRVLGRA